jgi:hypothetical protein
VFYGKPIPLTERNRESGGWGFAGSPRRGGSNEDDEENLTDNRPVSVATRPTVLSPCHIWRPETALEKKASMIELQKINEALEPEFREAWEPTTGMRRLATDQVEGHSSV